MKKINVTASDEVDKKFLFIQHSKKFKTRDDTFEYVVNEAYEKEGVKNNEEG